MRGEERDCRIYWGSHGCDKQRGHHGKHVCDCGGRPYYGFGTFFYGEDVPADFKERWGIRDRLFLRVGDYADARDVG